MRAKFTATLVVSLILVLCFSLVTQACPIPVFTSISPANGTNNESVNVTITGAKFHKSAWVKLTQAGQPDIVATNVTLVSKTELTCTLDLKGKAVGKWDVIVGNTGSISKKEKPASPPGSFTIDYPTPVVKAIIPKQGLIDSVVSVSIAGSYFRKGAKVVLTAPGQKDLNAEKLTVTSDSQINCDLNLTGSTAGLYDVKVINEDGKSGVLAKVFQIENQPPSIKMILPNRGANDGPITVVLTGSYFDKGATTKLVKAGQPEIQGNNIAVVSSSNMSASFDLTSKEVGSYDVVVSNPDGKTAVMAGGFLIDKLIEQRLLKSIFFDFDKSNVRQDQQARVSYNLDIMNDFKNSYIVLDGHADERGTREYNVALATRRAETIKQILVEKGFDPAKITINAYGEDFPVKKGHNEASWWYNRRVDLSIWETNPASWSNRSQSIFFEAAEANIDQFQSYRLDQSVELLTKNKNSFVILVASTKDYDSSKENQTLAKQRLSAISDYLIKAGVSADRISTIDNGKLFPFFSGAVDANVSVDNRVDLLVIEF